MECDQLFLRHQLVPHTEHTRCLKLYVTLKMANGLWLKVTMGLTRTVLCTDSFHARVRFRVTSYLAASSGSDVVPRNGSFRTLHLTAYLTSVVLVTSYSAALVSSIASRHATLPFTTFQEFLNDGTYRLGVVANSSIISNMRVWYINSLTRTFTDKWGRGLQTLTPP